MVVAKNKNLKKKTTKEEKGEGEEEEKRNFPETTVTNFYCVFGTKPTRPTKLLNNAPIDSSRSTTPTVAKYVL